MCSPSCQRIAAFLPALVALLAIGRASAAPSAPSKQIDEERIAALVRNLDANQYAIREAASEELLRVGEPALPAIKAALATSPSLEVKNRCERLVLRIIPWGDLPHELSLERLMKVVKDVNGANDPVRACRDWKLESLLDCWVRFLGQVSELPKCQPPVQLSDVRLAVGTPRDGETIDQATDSLIVVKRGQIRSATRCIILAEEPIEIESAQDCIIISRSVAKVDRCQNSAVLAQCLVDSLEASRSILIAGGQVGVESAGDSIVAAGSELWAKSRRNLVVVNPSDDRSSRQGERSLVGAREVRCPELRLVESAKKNPMAERIRLLETLWQGNAVARIRLNDGKERTLRCGENIAAPDGKPIAGLERWRLVFANRGVAVFAKDDDFVTLLARH